MGGLKSGLSFFMLNLSFLHDPFYDYAGRFYRHLIEPVVWDPSRLSTGTKVRDFYSGAIYTKTLDGFVFQTLSEQLVWNLDSETSVRHEGISRLHIGIEPNVTIIIISPTPSSMFCHVVANA